MPPSTQSATPLVNTMSRRVANSKEFHTQHDDQTINAANNRFIKDATERCGSSVCLREDTDGEPEHLLCRPIGPLSIVKLMPIIWLAAVV
jgi:hypothetical protein